MTYNLKSGHATLDDLVDGSLAKNVALQGAKTIFYVEGNSGSDTGGDGLTWETAFKTLTVGLAASHADIGSGSRGWASRNVILCKGDYLDEDLVLLAQKTDVIGVGSVNAVQKCGLRGNHVPVTNDAFGTRFYNFFFIGDATTGGDIWTLGSKNANVQFHDCTFHADSTTAATAAIVSTGSAFVEIHNCKFTGKFSDATIEFGNGDTAGVRVVGNYIESAAVGLHFNSGVLDRTSGEEQYILVMDNVFVVATLAIHDESGLVRMIGNNCLSDADTGTAGAGVIVGTRDFMLNNLISGSDIDNTMIPPFGTVG